MTESLENDALTVSTRRTPVQGRSHETVQRILRATSRLLERMPLEEITTSRIAQESGVSVGGLYRFFPDKQTIIDAIAVQHVKEFEAQVRNRLLLPGSAGRPGVPEFGDRSLRGISGRPARFPDDRIRQAHQPGYARAADSTGQRRDGVGAAGTDPLSGHEKFQRAFAENQNRQRNGGTTAGVRLRTGKPVGTQKDYRRIKVLINRVPVSIVNADKTSSGAAGSPVRAAVYRDSAAPASRSGLRSFCHDTGPALFQARA